MNAPAGDYPTPEQKAQELAEYEARIAREAKRRAREDSRVNPRRK